MSLAVPNQRAPDPAPASQPVLPEKIGRFRVERVLGAGSQGMVVLARDEDLGREVALKLLRAGTVTSDSEGLMEEARIVSGFHHPNIVILYEVGRLGSVPYLVFEYVEGRSLASVLEEQGALGVERAVIQMSQILAGIDCAHRGGVVHGDLNPANVLLGLDDIMKVADFGLSTRYQEVQEDDQSVRGTLRYMAPEIYLGGAPSPAADVFALGAMLFEMVAGRRLIDNPNRAMVVDTILNGPLPSLADVGIAAPPEVEAVIRKAISLDRSVRYANAGEMKVDLDRYRVPREAPPGDDAPVAAEAFLLRRMSYAKGFSALSGRIGQVLKLASADSDASAGQLANVLAKDAMLAQRVLAMANSAYYRGGEITTITRAIVQLGLEQVRSFVTRTLLDNQLEAGSAHTRELMVQSFFAAALAKEVAAHVCAKLREDAFLYGMFHDLGRSLVAHYLEPEMAAILEHAERTRTDELTASRSVLGAAYHEIGMAVATHWGMPGPIAEAMRPLPRGEVSAPESPEQMPTLVSAFANAMTDSIVRCPDDDLGQAVHDLLDRARTPLGTGVDEWREGVVAAAGLTARYIRLVKVDAAASERITRLVAPAEVVPLYFDAPPGSVEFSDLETVDAGAQTLLPD